MKYVIFALIALLTTTGTVTATENFQSEIRRAKQQVMPALVHIEPVKEIFSSGKRMKIQVTGSGVIFSGDGYVLTNNHVAEKARHVKCTLENRQELYAEVIGLDALTDLAVLKLDMSRTDITDLPYAEFGNSDSLQVGQLVLALGSPLGLSRSLSMGVISSIDRYFEDTGTMVSPFNLWIQTDAAINPGNSGGPLVDLNGRVVGINARAIFFGENLGFAIPINTAKLVIDRILEAGEVKRSWLGIEWQEIKEYRRYAGKPDLEGVLVADIEEGSPAAPTELRPGDLITHINEEPVSAVYREELPKVRKIIADLPVGSQVALKRRSAEFAEEVRIETRPRGKFEGNEFECPVWGLSVKEITPRIAKNLKLDDSDGVLVSGVRSGSLADEADVFRGNVIKFVDDIRITDLEQFKEVYTEKTELPEKGIMLRLYFRNATNYALLKEN